MDTRFEDRFVDRLVQALGVLSHVDAHPADVSSGQTAEVPANRDDVDRVPATH